MPNESQRPSAVSSTAAPFLRSLPTGQGLVFIGVAGLRSDRKETIRLALEDAARRVAIFQSVYAEFFAEMNMGSSVFDYTNNVYTVINYDEESSAQYIDILEYNVEIDAIEIDNTLIIRTVYPITLPPLKMYYPEYSGPDRRPGWVDNPPVEISGYEVGLGFAGRHSTLTDTCAASFRNAIFSVIRNINTFSRSGDIDSQMYGIFDYQSGSENILYATASLVNFYVLDTWIDPKTKGVWTLAVAQKGD